MNINNALKCKLLASMPMKISNDIDVYPLTLKEIIDLGYDDYNLGLSYFVSDVEDYNIENIEDYANISSWDIFLSNILKGSDLIQGILIKLLYLFFKKNISLDEKQCCFYIGDNKNNILNKDNFEELKEVLKIQNCLQKNIEEKPKFANKKAEEIYNEIMKHKINLSKNKEVEFVDLISTLAANGNNLNILNIWDLTMYQFENQFARMQMIENYDINIRQLLTGMVKKEDLDLKHYIRKIEKQ